MKVLLINGSPHVDGCTNRALLEVSQTLNEEGIDSEIIQVGHLKINGCLACDKCREINKCVIDDLVNDVNDKLKDADGLVIGTPVYFSSPNGTLISFLDRLFRSANYDKRMKVGASITSSRRAGDLATFDVLNKYFTISEMPIVSSTYWNNVHGIKKEDVEQDLEGLQTMRILARNMAFLIKSINIGKKNFPLPNKENKLRTNFIK